MPAGTAPPDPWTDPDGYIEWLSFYLKRADDLPVALLEEAARVARALSKR